LQPPIWPITDILIVDCDSTLTAVEGIDELARMPGNQDEIALQVATLTKRAMEGDIPLETVYGRRLETVNPSQEQVHKIAHIYRETMIPHAKQVIAALQTLGTKVFIVSGGLIEPVRDFGVWLGIPRDHIFAVSMEYDQLAGKWWRYWDQPGGQNPRSNYLSIEANPLTGSGGKNRMIQRIRAENAGRAMLVGDGLSDLEAGNEVDLFVGFGGAVHRPRIAELSTIYIHTQSLAPILPLALGQTGNVPRFAMLWAEGLRRIFAGEVTFKNEELRYNFTSAMRRVNSSNQ
jgi:phosphoserine phosphatase